MKSGFLERDIEAIVARELRDAMLGNVKARCKVSLSRHFSCLKRAPDAMLRENDAVAACKRAERGEVQSCAAKPVF